jgi:hypothetical protein
LEFCKKKQKNVAKQFFSNFEEGDAYSYLAIKRETGLFVAFSVGKWIQAVSDELYELIAKRTKQPTCKSKIDVCSDGNDQNENALLKFFNKDCVNYGQVIKDKEKQIVYGSHKRKVIGNMPYDQISIAHVDGLCAALRERIKCSVRRAKTFAKKRRTIKDLLSIYQAYHNLINSRFGQTPCMKEGLVGSIWSWSKLLHTRLSYLN